MQIPVYRRVRDLVQYYPDRKEPCIWPNQDKLFIDLIIRWGSCWIGCHYSYYHSSVCIALIPCIVIRIAKKPFTGDK